MNLKPCKKCGYPDGRHIAYHKFSGEPKYTRRISCPRCGYCTKEKATKEEAIEAWNRRAEE